MECTTNKPGVQCKFMSKKGCKYLGGACFEIVEQCEGCARVVRYETGNFCSVYPHPAMKWRKGICNFATHLTKEVMKDEAGRKINPLKAAKRASRKR
ncbi:MAG: hypothetical protein AVO38_08230 [delta proteobacterium ML8_D]|nr:MAG: hypothetical protein AVO38_08230 [delta proteobacterium ML8_D]